MVSLDVVSLFTKVPLDYTINIILDKIYKEKKDQNQAFERGIETVDRALYQRNAF